VGARRWLAVTVVLAAGCAGTPPAGDTIDPATTIAPATTTKAAGQQRSTTVLAAGDIASCTTSGDEQTAALLDTLPGTVLTLRDTVYDDGSASQFARCYAPSWGRFRDRTYPAPGNHDYQTAGASGYYGFFGPRAGQPGNGWYSFNLGRWHLIALNSNCNAVGGCQPGSEQERWLWADLAAHPARCTLAFWHHPRFSSGTTHGSDPAVGGLWVALYQAGADVVLVGHEHNYERFAPLDPQGRVDPARACGSWSSAPAAGATIRSARRFPAARRATATASASFSSSCVRPATPGASCRPRAVPSRTRAPAAATERCAAGNRQTLPAAAPATFRRAAVRSERALSRAGTLAHHVGEQLQEHQGFIGAGWNVADRESGIADGGHEVFGRGPIGLEHHDPSQQVEHFVGRRALKVEKRVTTRSLRR
jgi:Calcineurin-like phosphoesterase